MQALRCSPKSALYHIDRNRPPVLALESGKREKILKKAADDAENELIQRTVTPYANGVALAAARQEFVCDGPSAGSVQGNLVLAFNPKRR
jgi:hypothetical protein